MFRITSSACVPAFGIALISSSVMSFITDNQSINFQGVKRRRIHPLSPHLLTGEITQHQIGIEKESLQRKQSQNTG